MSAFRRTLPSRPNLEQQKKLAKDLIDAFRAGDAEAVARLRAELPDKKEHRARRCAVRPRQRVRLLELARTKAPHRVDCGRRAPLVERFKKAVNDRDARALRRLAPERDALRAIINEPIFNFDSPALVSASDADVAGELLELGADPNRRSSWWAGGFHPLYGATPATAELLLAAGAIPDACAAAHLDRLDLLSDMLAADPSRVHERGGDGQMPLHFARSRAVVDLLLAAGADIDARDIDHRSTAAEWMLDDARYPEKSRIEIAEYLVERGATADIFLAAALGDTRTRSRAARRESKVARAAHGTGRLRRKAAEQLSHLSVDDRLESHSAANGGAISSNANVGRDAGVRVGRATFAARVQRGKSR